jgi:hypothetical protein
MLLISIGSTVYANLMLSTQLTCVTSIVSGDPVIEMADWEIIAHNTVDANGNGVVEGDELKIEPVTDGAGEVVALDVTVDPALPNWHLELATDIHNMEDSIPVWLNRQIYYFDSEGNQVPTDEDGLLTLFSMRYSDSWYTSDGEPIQDITTYDVYPSQTVTHVESLTFEGQLEGQSFSFLVEVTATFPNGG